MIPTLAQITTALKNNIPNSGAAKRIAKLQGLANAFRDIETAMILDQFGANGSQRWASEVDTSAPAMPDFTGWSVQQVDSYLNANPTASMEGGADE